MFAQNGETRPRLRLAGFDGDWIKVRLKDCFFTYAFKEYLALPKQNGRYPVIQQGDKPIAGYSDDNKPFENYKEVVVLGDHTLSLYKPDAPFFVATDGVRILRAHSLNRDFFFCFLRMYRPISQGYKRHFPLLVEQEGFIPPTDAEQAALGRFFADFDKIIALQAKKGEKLRQITAGCLERMFVQ